MTNGDKNHVSSFRLRHSFVLRHSGFVIKKVPPPTPDGREGRLFPPEQSWKTALQVIELTGRRNKILHELMQHGAGFAKKLKIFRARRVCRSAIERDEMQRKACANWLRAF
jgi:hypothetical protein